jgi:hypothetical protein
MDGIMSTITSLEDRPSERGGGVAYKVNYDSVLEHPEVRHTNYDLHRIDGSDYAVGAYVVAGVRIDERNKAKDHHGVHMCFHRHNVDSDRQQALRSSCGDGCVRRSVDGVHANR